MHERVIGIDLGTTFSAVATVEAGVPKIIRNRGGGLLTPSMVGFTPDGERVVGERARLLAEEYPHQVAYATKRFIGRRWSPELAASARGVVPYALVGGPSGDTRVKLGPKTLPLTQISAMILGELKLDAEASFGRPVSKAVITVPANFDDAQRTETKEAARIAGLEVLRIINEPTSAALAYGLAEGFRGRVLVFDLGGGTFDISILDVESGVFQVKATGGDSALGGEDFDNRIVEWLLAQVPENFRDSTAKDRLSRQRLKTAAERAKRELTEQDEAQITVGDLGDHEHGKRFTTLETALTRQFFETLCEPLSRRCLDVCQQVMTDSSMDPQQVDAVLLVGGMTRVPFVRRLVSTFFGKQPAGDVNPDEVVALGAAIHANELAQKAGKALLMDVASHSLGVGTLGGSVRRLIERNSPIPTVARETFHPGRAGQKEARIPIFQGEGATADENTRLGEVVLRDLNVRARSEVSIEVSFELSSEGTLSVRATDLSTGIAEAVRIEARAVLGEEERDLLAKEQADYAAVASAKDAAQASAAFQRTLERAERLTRALASGAAENPSPEAEAAVAKVRSLVDVGRGALKAQSTERMVEISRLIQTLMPSKVAKANTKAG